MTRRSALHIGLLVVLALSLLTNFFLLGFMVKGFGGLPGRAIVGDVIGAYPKEVRKEFRRSLKADRASAKAALEELRRAHAALAAASQATPIDDAAVEAAMLDVRTATSALQEVVQDHLLAALKKVREEAD